ncbi:MAG: phage head closure protein [Lachnospiraceae bacterium]|nr:phage head closure protein [Lachnospiraceae bacterium]
MKGRVNIIRKTSEVVEGRKSVTVSDFYECWCEIQSLGTNEKYTALQTGIENALVFKVRECGKIKEVRMNTKEFYVEYDGTELKIYDASPMFTDCRWVLLKCRASA